MTVNTIDKSLGGIWKWNWQIYDYQKSGFNKKNMFFNKRKSNFNINIFSSYYRPFFSNRFSHFQRCWIILKRFFQVFLGFFLVLKEKSRECILWRIKVALCWWAALVVENAMDKRKLLQLWLPMKVCNSLWLCASSFV